MSSSINRILKSIPIGHEDFKEVIDKNCYYADKTLMIKDLIDDCIKVGLYTRPRRFGKTLNMSMLRYYFERSATDNSYLFDNLAIAKSGAFYKQFMGRYPVISLSFSNVKQGTFEHSFDMYKDTVSSEYKRHDYVLSSDKISDSDKKQYNLLCNKQGTFSDYMVGIKFLSDCLFRVHDEKVIILIDDYDVLLENAHFGGFYDEMAELVYSDFDSALKTSNSLEFGVLVGTVIDSNFTSLTNCNIYSIMNNGYSQYFGFTEDEVENLLSYYNLLDLLDDLRDWYGRYLFGTTDIYNPCSVLSYINSVRKDDNFYAEFYWLITSSNNIVRELLLKVDDTIRDDIKDLFNAEIIYKRIYEDVTYRNVGNNTNYIWSLLLSTGCLSISGFTNNAIGLSIPNNEVKQLYKDIITEWSDEQVTNDTTSI